MAARIIALIGLLALIIGGIGGWFAHDTLGPSRQQVCQQLSAQYAGSLRAGELYGAFYKERTAIAQRYQDSCLHS
jgi:hypothetical protein